MCSSKAPEERQQMKDAEKTKKLEEEKRKGQERDKQEHEKGNNGSDMSYSFLYHRCNVWLQEMYLLKVMKVDTGGVMVSSAFASHFMINIVNQ